MTTTATGGSNGFFSDLKSGISNTLNEFLPVWASLELQQQYRNQLAQPTYDANAAPPRNNDGMTSTTQVRNPATTQVRNPATESTDRVVKTPMNLALLIGGGLLLLGAGAVYLIVRR